MKIIPLTEGMTNLPIRAFVEQNIYGQLTMSDADGWVLATVMAMCEGDHLEIGVLNGGSAVLCALAKTQLKQEGNIYGVDPFPGWTPNRTPKPPPPTIENAEKNVVLHGFEDRVFLYKGYHPPLPPELRNMRFASAFIDGEHTFKSALADWENIKDKVDGIIVFHDIHNPAAGAGTVFEMACRDPEWDEIHRESKTGVVQRVGYEPRSYEDTLKELGVEDEQTSDT